MDGAHVLLAKTNSVSCILYRYVRAAKLDQSFSLPFFSGTREGCFDVAKHGLSVNISVTFQLARLNLSAYFINHCLAILSKL